VNKLFSRRRLLRRKKRARQRLKRMEKTVRRVQ
jgi:hypothetical protein